MNDSLNFILPQKALVVAVLSLSVQIGAARAAIAPPYVDSIMVRLRAGPPKGGDTLVSERDLDEMSVSLGVKIKATGKTPDDAVLLTLDPPLIEHVAMEALRRLRQNPLLVYAEPVHPHPNQTTAKESVTPTKEHLIFNRLIVKYKDAQPTVTGKSYNATDAAMNRVSQVLGQSVVQDRTLFNGAVLLKAFNQSTPEQALQSLAILRNDPGIEYAEFDAWAFPTLDPTDPLYPNQWHYMGSPGGVHLPGAWSLSNGSPGIRTAVLDTGSLADHPDLAGRFIGGYDFVSDPTLARDGNARDPNPNDEGDWTTAGYCYTGAPAKNSSWHGTHVAGTVGAATNNAIGGAGINWASSVVPIRVLAACGGTTSDIADAIAWASGAAVTGIPANSYPAHIINLSLGGSGSCSATYQNAINTALANNVTVIVAAGNSNTDAINTQPANCSGVITVAANGYSGQRASYSNYGGTVEITAPGGDGPYGVLSTIGLGATTLTGYDYKYYQGTSMATPHVAGIASLLKSENPDLTPSQISSVIQSTARAFPVGTGNDCNTSICGAGIIDASAAVASVTPTPENREGIAGVSSIGQIWYTRDLTAWDRATGELAQVDAGAFTGLIGTTVKGAIWYTTNLSTWTASSGTLKQAIAANLDGDANSDIVGVNTAGDIWYNQGQTWIKIPGTLKQVAAGDINGDGLDDIVGVNPLGSIWYTTNRSTWTRMPGELSQVAVGDINGDGRADVAGVGFNGTVWYTSNLNTWTPISANLVQIDIGDLNGDGLGDIAGLSPTGNIWYTKNLIAWTPVPGQLAQITVGRF